MSEFVVITGLSGAGRSQAADDLEDLGWFVIDNLPTELIPKVVELVAGPGLGDAAGRPGRRRRRPPRRAAARASTALRASGRPGARSCSSRPAPTCSSAATRAPAAATRCSAAGEGLAEAIERERALLEPVKAEADVVVDTTDLNVHELHDRIVGLFGEDDADAGMQTARRVLRLQARPARRRRRGARLPLPAQPALGGGAAPADRPRRAGARATCSASPPPVSFLDHLDGLLDLLLPAYVAEGKAYLTLAFGCTGGRHRSVVIAEEVAELPARPRARADRGATATSTSESTARTGTRRPDLLGWPDSTHDPRSSTRT